MIKAGRDLWRSSGTITLSRQGHLQPVAQDHAQTDFEYLQRLRLHNLLGEPVLVLSDPHTEKVFPDIQREPLMFQCVPIASGPATGHH